MNNTSGDEPVIEVGIISFVIGMFGTYTILDLANRRRAKKIKKEYEVPLATRI